MRSKAALVLVLIVSLAAPDARADSDGPVHLLALVAETKLKRDKKLLKKADEGLREGALESLGDRADIASRARSARCVTSARCVGKLAKRADASQGAAFLLKEGAGGDLVVAYLVASAGGEVLLSGERTYSKEGLADGLRQLVRELLVPASLSGKLMAPSVDETAWVAVDGVPVAASALAAGLAMSLGEHEVLILRQGAEPERHTVDVKFGEDAVVELAAPPPPPQPEVIVRMPLWPTFVGAGATGGFLGVTTIFLLDFVFAATQGLGSAGDIQASAEADLTPAEVARQPSLVKARRAMQTDLLIAGVATTGMLVAAACTAALAAAWALSAADEGEPASKDKTPDAAAAPSGGEGAGGSTGEGPVDDAPDGASAPDGPREDGAE